MSARKDGIETRQRILDTACTVFSSKGFHDATHAEICRLSNVNPAAINYHFKNKETLYVEAWKMAFRASMERYPPDSGIAPDAPPEVRLRGRINALVRRAHDPACREFDLLHKEFSNPTGLLEAPLLEMIKPLQESMIAVIRALTGPRVSEPQVALCAMSIMAQCFYQLRRRHHCVKTPIDQLTQVAPEVMAEHIFQFSLAGIRELRRQYTQEN